MTKLEEVKTILEQKDASLVVCYASGEIKAYYQDRIKDIKAILQKDSNALKGAIVADKVIGKVAASIMAVAGVKELYAKTLSKIAISVLKNAKIQYSYENLVDYIQNNDKTGMCPMENKYKDEAEIEKIYQQMLEKK